MSNSNFTITLTPGYVFSADELITLEKLNLLANPTINVSGSFSSASIADNSITLAKLQAGIFTADAAGRAPFVSGWLNLDLIGSGIFTADASGRAPFANKWLSLALVGDDIFAATTAGRAPFADGAINAALMQPDAYWYAGSSTGTAAAYVIAFSPTLSAYASPTLSAYWDGLIVAFKAHAANSAGATLNAGLGVKSIYRMDGTAIKANDILSSGIVELRYNSSFNSGAGGWQLITPPGGGSGQYVTPGGSEQSVNVDQAQAVEETHGLTSTPKKLRWVLVCQSTENGYAAGDEVDVATLFNGGAAPIYNVGANATKVWCVRSNSGTALKMVPRTGGAPGAVADTAHIADNWKFKCYAEI